ncbi:MAG: phosphate acyltransferase PlsX [Clostridiales bacterium]|jgi:glycerol-3-phosphate acyltransferase PlsX|nr:phosphate acyltransferase PlsX [Clostridiales bacterium]
MARSMLIAVDAMGGDNAPAEIVKGAVNALADERIKIIFLGAEEAIRKELSQHLVKTDQVEIIAASEVITNEESPTNAIRQKKNSSMVLGLRLLKDRKASAFVSAGATGALLTGATVIVGRIPGIERPALGALLPNEKNFSLLIDCGANVDAKPNYLVQFAKMGSIYMENVLGVREPRVGLLNIGAESEKGNALTKEAYALLENAVPHFVGNVEARDVPWGAADVIVCDAFVGNVVLKYTEGFAKAIMGVIQKELMSSTVSKLGALLAKNALRRVKNSFDYAEVGGAPFLGLRALVVKAHGSSDAKAIQAAIRGCAACLEKDIARKIESSLIQV